MGRLIGVDHGQRRIGLAVGDAETGLAFPRPALAGGRGAPEAIRALADVEGTRQVVVGLPLNMDGSEGPQAAAARAFGARLAEVGLEVAFSDERLTSWAAGQRLAEAGPDRIGADAIDSAAAALILEQYLAARRRAPGPEEH